MDSNGGRWGTRHPIHSKQCQAVINAALSLLDSDNFESAKALLRAFSGDLAHPGPNDGLDLEGNRPDVGQNSSEVVE